MWKVILGVVLGVVGLLCGLLVAIVVFFVLTDHYRINWYHGDDRLSWTFPLFLVLGPVLGSISGILLGRKFDRRRAWRHQEGDSAEPNAAPNGNPAASVDNPNTPNGLPSVSRFVSSA